MQQTHNLEILGSNPSGTIKKTVVSMLLENYGMLIKTELIQFQDGKIRMVNCPSDAPSLDEIYHYGQNDIQPQIMTCSLSAGDLIHLNNKIYLIANHGFKELDNFAANEYRKMEFGERLSMLH